MRYIVSVLLMICLVGCEDSVLVPEDSVTGAVHYGEGDVVPLSQVKSSIMRDLGVTEWDHIYFEDAYYTPYTLAQLRQYLASNDVDTLTYVNNTWDCDDYAEALLGDVTRALPGIPFGIVWVVRQRMRQDKVYTYLHVLNVFYDAFNDTTYLVEPQDDRVFKGDEFVIILMMKGFTL